MFSHPFTSPSLHFIVNNSIPSHNILTWSSAAAKKQAVQSIFFSRMRSAPDELLAKRSHRFQLTINLNIFQLNIVFCHAAQTRWVPWKLWHKLISEFSHRATGDLHVLDANWHFMNATNGEIKEEAVKCLKATPKKKWSPRKQIKTVFSRAHQQLGIKPAAILRLSARSLHFSRHKGGKSREKVINLTIKCFDCSFQPLDYDISKRGAFY